MTQEARKPINLSVHESADPSVINPNLEKEASGNKEHDLNDSVHDEENVDIPIPGLSEDGSDSNPVDRQLSIVNRSAG